MTNMAFIGGFELLFLVPFVLLSLASFAFWIWMLVDCLTNPGVEGTEKIVWVLVIALTHLIGAAIYFFVGRPKRQLVGTMPPRVS